MATNAFSAEVSLELWLDNQRVPLSHVSRDYCVTASDCGVIPQQDAVLSVRVDEHTDETPVRLLEPIRGENCRVPFERLTPEANGSLTGSASKGSPTAKAP